MTTNRQVVALVAAPDTEADRRVLGLMRMHARALDGTAGTVIGYDIGDASRTFGGPVAMVPNVTNAQNTASTPAGIYKPVAEFQNSVSTNPELDPYDRALWYRAAR